MSQVIEHEVPSMGVDNRKLGIWTFLGSEVMFFSGLIVVYLVMRGRSTTSGLVGCTATTIPR